MSTPKPAPWFFEAPAPTFTPPDPDAAAPRRRNFSGIAYSGQPVADGRGSPIVIDLATLSLPKSCPVLLGHDRDRRVGVCRLAVTGEALTCEGYLLANDDALALAADADEGFPWQLSVHAQPASTEEVKLGGQIQVNGQTLSGPLTIFRHAAIRELSFTPTGVDPNTQASVWSSKPPPVHQPEEAPTMSQIEDAQAQLAQLSADIVALRQAVADATARAETAETALAAHQRTTRLAAVQATFARLGRQVTDAESEVYLALDAPAWERISQDLLAAKPNAAAHLFEEQAGGDPNPEPPLKLSAIYAARREVKQ